MYMGIGYTENSKTRLDKDFWVYLWMCLSVRFGRPCTIQKGLDLYEALRVYDNEVVALAYMFIMEECDTIPTVAYAETIVKDVWHDLYDTIHENNNIKEFREALEGLRV